mmetsp:Transcript_17314/g.43159  ORF Transcript_17314/g.43159 Transcript_17314/m.43159 type:complete len:208 (+) Transcript_17314:560-1183(+)
MVRSPSALRITMWTKWTTTSMTSSCMLTKCSRPTLWWGGASVPSLWLSTSSSLFACPMAGHCGGGCPCLTAIIFRYGMTSSCPLPLPASPLVPSSTTPALPTACSTMMWRGRYRSFGVCEMWRRGRSCVTATSMWLVRLSKGGRSCHGSSSSSVCARSARRREIETPCLPPHQHRMRRRGQNCKHLLPCCIRQRRWTTAHLQYRERQ